MFDTGEVRSELAQLAQQVCPVSLAREQRVPVLAALEPLVPAGLRRGATHAVRASAGGASGATSLALALAAEASATGSWVAAVGFPSLGLVAADELGVALERLVLVAAPAPRAWPSVVAALVDGFDIVLVRPNRGLRAADARRLRARALERGTVLVVAGDLAGDAPDVSLDIVASEWHGLGTGHGHLRARRVTVETGGRRDAARTRRADLWLPSADGRVEVVVAEPVPLRRAPTTAGDVARVS